MSGDNCIEYFCVRLGFVAKKNSVNDDDSVVPDDATDMIDEYEEMETKHDLIDSYEARRRLEKIMEEKELQRLISGDFYD